MRQSRRSDQLSMGPGLRRDDRVCAELAYFNQPRLRKYQNGAIALAIISAQAQG
jgi:hypothetical protein